MQNAKFGRLLKGVVALTMAGAMLLTSGPAAVAATTDSTRKQNTAKVSYGEKVTVSSLADYRISDFIDENGNAVTGAESSTAAPKKYSTSDLYSAGNYTNLLKGLFERGSLRGGYDEVVEEDVDEAAPEAVASTEAVDGDYSTTNVQVAGVDEADIIKTDGKYVYYLSSSGLTIVKADGANMKVVGKMQSKELYDSNYFREMYISGDKLIVVGQSNIKLFPAAKSSEQLNKNYTDFLVLDISDKASPKVSRTVRIEGYNITTRFTNNTLYFVNDAYSYAYSVNDPLVSALPTFYDSALSSEVCVIPMSRVRLPKENGNSYGVGYTIIGCFDVTKPSVAVRPQANAGMSSPYVYMSQNSLYMGFTNYGYYGSESTFTEIYRYAPAGDNKMTYVANGNVDGYPLNQYSMDEYQGYFRIAITKPATSTAESVSTLYVLDAKTLNGVGKVTGLGQSERIYSVRFSGDTAYVVTFRETDPLYVLDLSNPSQPKAVGELKIPGFSSYLHPYGKNYLIGIGREFATTYRKDESGKDVAVGNTDVGLKLSLFDVSDPKNPKEIQKQVIGTSSATYSPAGSNPKTAMVDLSKGVFAFPIEYGAVGSDGQYDASKSWQGGVVVSVSPTKGFTIKLKAKVSSGSGYYSSYEDRFCYIGNTLYFISGSKMQAYNYNTYKKLSEITIK